MLRASLALMMFLSATGFAREQRFGLGTQLGVHGGTGVTGAELVMPLSESVEMSYAYVQGQTSLTDDIELSNADFIYKADFTLAETSVTLRWFIGRTFYVGGGFGYRRMVLDLGGFDASDGTRVEGSYNGQALQTKALIGNLWKFSNGLYLGVDWIGFGFPMSVTQSKLGATESNILRSQSLSYYSEENNSDYKHMADKISRSTMGTLLTLRFGYMF
ncbi:hypothetical protein [Oligoflexus tunisiensis]|uniref:hypothetical protein n=1 Tax=Oligoflexus tunisiensis TaxID=708132 RepID=UPI00114CDF28|nr:hypothetical protein [Oligoflexus tunisiensis]